jgi:hypothetical protein
MILAMVTSKKSGPDCAEPDLYTARGTSARGHQVLYWHGYRRYQTCFAGVRFCSNNGLNSDMAPFPKSAMALGARGCAL